MISRITDNPQIQGILCVVCAWILIAFQDSMLKWLSDKYPLHEIVFFRSFIAMTLTLVIIYFEAGFKSIRTPFWRVHVMRGLLLVISNMTFFLALASMPLAEAVSIFFISPVLITALSALFLAEQVGYRRWIAVFLGLTGTIIMLRPGADMFRFISLLPLFAALTYSFMQILTRKIGLREKASTMAFFVQLCFICVSIIIGLIAGDGRFTDVDQHASMQFLLRAWIIPSRQDFILFILTGVLIACIGYLLAQAYRITTASTLAPFEYVNLPISLILGLVIWGDWPDRTSFIGIALIIFGGFIIIMRKPSTNKNKIPQN